MAVMNAVRILRRQLQQHVDLVPLMGAYVGAGILASGIMLYTSIRKEDVVYNRWTNPMPSLYIDPTKHQQKFLVLRSSSKACYTRDKVVEDLRNEIYKDQKYIGRHVEKHH